MSEEKLVSVIRDFADAYVKRDVEKILSLLTEDVVWVQPEGTFKGKEEAKRYLTWDVQITPDTKLRYTGVDIMVKGNKAVYTTCRMIFTAFSETWIQSNYLIANVSWWPEPATPNDINAVVLKFILELVESA